MYIRYIIFTFLLFSYVFAQDITRFCSVPPFLQEGTFSNLFLVLDYSGSMADYTYHNGKKEEYEKFYDKNKTYYGFFIPDQKYSEKCEYIQGNEICYYKVSENGILGSFLNFKYMTRIDILRWILTGGIKKEDYVILPKLPKIWTDDDHIIRNEVRIYVKDASTYDKQKKDIKGLLQEIAEYKKKPRIGLVIFGGGEVEGEFNYEDEKNTAIIKSWMYPTYSYKRIISEINNTKPSGGTPTGEALEDVKNYFALENLKWISKKTKINRYQNPYKFDVDNDGYEEIVSCTRNFAVLITDGAWNGHKYSNQENLTCEKGSTKIVNPADVSVRFSCAVDPAEPAYYMWKGGKADLVKDIKGKQNVKVYTIAAFLNTNYGLNAVKNIAVYGGFTDLDDNNIPCLYNNIPTPYPECNASNKVCNTVFGTKCDNCGSFLPLPEETCSEWDNNKDGLPDSYKRGDSPQELKKAVTSIFENILKNLASSTSVSAFYSRTKESVVAVQSIFFPEKKFDSKNLTWLGYLYSYWFFNSQEIQNLREDTNENKVLDIIDDDIIEFFIDDKGLLKINKYLADISGKKDEYIETYSSLNEVKYLWEAGKELSETYPEERDLFTNINDERTEINDISLIRNYLGSPESFPKCLGDNNEERVKNLIRYIKGYDIEGCRNRTLPNGDIWKLGDIIYSSPKIVNYPEKGYAVVFTGSNSGILHAFKVGYLSQKNLGKNQLARLCSSKENCIDEDFGKELWGFIPKNALPYLRYLPDPDYCHMYFIDLTPFVFSYKDRKILIGGMRLGGACGCSGSNCINPPSDTCPVDGECVGLSSYFALDITDPENPQFMWEFSDNDLGFSFSGPGIIRKKDKAYVLFASGPTNYQGDSDQNLKLFIIDLETGSLVRKIDTGIHNAFGGRLFTEGLDINGDNSTDYIAFGFSKKQDKGWSGGVFWGDVRDKKFDLWEFKEILHTGRPVTAKVAYMKCFNNLYLYLGTGRWFYKTDESSIKESNKIYGLKIDCDDKGDCKINTNFAKGPSNACGSKPPISWFIPLEKSNKDYFAERMITDPTISKQNIVIFTTTEPTEDVCSFGGKTRVWVLNCATGGALADECSNYPLKKLEGNLLLQLSGGDIKEINVKAFVDKKTQKRGLASKWMTGTPPESSIPLITTGRIKGKWGEMILWLEK